MPKIEYEKITHTYKEDGLVRLSCTQILADNGITGLDGVSQSLLEANGQFGKAVHAAVQFKCKGTLDLKTVDQPILEYLKCWDNFVEDFGYQSEEQEVFGIHPKYHFGYQVDQIGLLGKGKYIGTCMMDIKTGSPKPSDLIQLGGYSFVKMAKHHFLLYLNPEFKPRGYKVIFSKKVKREQQIFLACLTISNYKREKGLT